MRQLVSETHAGVSGERAKGEERRGRSTRNPELCCFGELFRRPSAAPPASRKPNDATTWGKGGPVPAAPATSTATGATLNDD